LAVLPLKYVGEKVLRRKAARVAEIDKPLVRLLDDMVETMYAAQGIGLAGPQIGVSRRIIVVDAGDGPIQLVNPRIVDHKGRAVGTEGCLSIPSIYGEVERWKQVVVKGLNAKGEPVAYEASGLFAVVLQHEIDHLDGRLFTDLATDLVDAEAIEREQGED
jgi:peptide deformylase